MAEIVNPYIAGAPVVEKRMFFGRDMCSIGSTQSERPIFRANSGVHGQRRFARASYSNNSAINCGLATFPVFFLIYRRTHTTLDRFMWWLTREIVRVLNQNAFSQFHHLIRNYSHRIRIF